MNDDSDVTVTTDNNLPTEAVAKLEQTEPPASVTTETPTQQVRSI